MRNLKSVLATLIAGAAIATVAPAAPASAALMYDPEVRIGATKYGENVSSTVVVLDNDNSRKAFTFEVMKDNRGTTITVPAGTVKRHVVKTDKPITLRVNGMYDTGTMAKKRVLPTHSAAVTNISNTAGTLRVTNRYRATITYAVDTMREDGTMTTNILTVPAGTTGKMQVGLETFKQTLVQVHKGSLTVFSKRIEGVPAC